MPTGLRSRPTFSCSHRFLHERADPCLVAGGQLRQSEGGRPHGAFVEPRLVAEAERRVPRLELLRALEEADDLAVLGIRGHPVPESRREGWRAGFDDRMEPLADGAIRFRHFGNRREHGAFPVRLVRARAGARGRLLRGLLGGALGASDTFSHFCSLSLDIRLKSDVAGADGCLRTKSQTFTASWIKTTTNSPTLITPL